MCCFLLTVPVLNKFANMSCNHCADIGCNIYNERPYECALFECSYYQSNANVDLRPDNSKIIFEKITDEIFFATQHPDFEITEIALKQILHFNQTGFSVVVAKSGKYKINPAFNKTEKSIYEEFKQYLKAKNGHS